MRTEYVPSRWSRDTRDLSPKTLRNIWITMCSFFRWANSEFHIESPMKNVPAPRFQKVESEPFTREEVSRMLKACTYSKEADTTYRRQFVMRRPTANRDQAIILTLLDSCVRASEFWAGFPWIFSKHFLTGRLMTCFPQGWSGTTEGPSSA